MNGVPVDDVPPEALPDCEACEKPELDPSNYETVLLYEHCKNQQHYGTWGGERLGVRMEAVVAVLNELCLQGKIQNRERAFRRVSVLDAVCNDVWNAANVKKDAPQRDEG